MRDTYRPMYCAFPSKGSYCLAMPWCCAGWVSRQHLFWGCLSRYDRGRLVVCARCGLCVVVYEGRLVVFAIGLFSIRSVKCSESAFRRLFVRWLCGRLVVVLRFAPIARPLLSKSLKNWMLVRMEHPKSHKQTRSRWSCNSVSQNTTQQTSHPLKSAMRGSMIKQNFHKMRVLLALSTIFFARKASGRRKLARVSRQTAEKPTNANVKRMTRFAWSTG